MAQTARTRNQAVPIRRASALRNSAPLSPTQLNGVRQSFPITSEIPVIPEAGYLRSDCSAGFSGYQTTTHTGH